MQIADLFARLTLKPDKQSFSAADKLLSGVKTALLGLAAIKTGEYLAGLVEDTVAMGAAAVDTGTKLGISAQEVQSLQFAAKESGADIESVTTAYAHMAKGLLEAKQKGTGPLVDGLQALGISMSDPAVQNKNLSEIFGLVADKMNESSDAAKNLGVGMTLFGRGGKDLIPLLARGSKGIEELRQKAIDLGYAMDNDANASLKAFSEQSEEMKASLIGVRNEAVVAILPYLKELVDDFLAWIKANKTILAQRLAAVLRGIATALQIVGKVMGVLIDVIQWLAKNFGFVLAVLAAITLALGIYKAAAIQAAIATAVEWALAALPFVLMAALILGLILIIEDFYTWIVGGDSVFKEMYESVKHWIGEGIANVINGVIDDINELIAKFEDLMRRVNKLASGALGHVLSGVTGANTEAIADNLGGENYTAGRIGHVHEGDWSGDPTRAEQIANMRKRGMVQGSDGNWIQGPTTGSGGIDANVKIDITIPPGSSPKEIADITADAMQKFWSGQVRRLAGANGGNR